MRIIRLGEYLAERPAVQVSATEAVLWIQSSLIGIVNHFQQVAMKP